MARYWIRNRGRVQGPFSEERIQGLLRRGRFNRHFHVSEDRKNWYPASEFPELFAGVGKPEPADDESPFATGGSPFDDDPGEDDEPPVEVPTSERKRRSSSRRASVRDEDDDIDDDDDIDEEWEDDEDEDWDDDDVEGVIPKFINWVERHALIVGGVLLITLGILSWFVFFREDFTQDVADMETLMTIQNRMTQAHQLGRRADEWIVLMESTDRELAPLVARLEENASAMDMVKQELLFLARDDLPQMFKELPEAKRDAENRVKIRFNLVDEMIKAKIRWHDGTALMPQRQPSRLPPQTPPEAEADTSGQEQPPAGESTVPTPTGSGTAPLESSPGQPVNDGSPGGFGTK